MQISTQYSEIHKNMEENSNSFIDRSSRREDYNPAVWSSTILLAWKPSSPHEKLEHPTRQCLKEKPIRPLICHYYYHLWTLIPPISTILHHVIYHNLSYNSILQWFMLLCKNIIYSPLFLINWWLCMILSMIVLINQL